MSIPPTPVLLAPERPGSRWRDLPSWGDLVEFEDLGCVALFPSEPVTLGEMRARLGPDWILASDGPLPGPLDAGRHGRGGTPTPWPEASGVPRAHRDGRRGAGVFLGVLDTGIDADHDEFAGRTIPFRYVSLDPSSPYRPPRDVRGFDTDGHGTHVAGIAGGRRGGVAPEAELAVVSVIESETRMTSLLRLAHGLDWLLRQARRRARPAVISISVGFPPFPPEEACAEDVQARLALLRAMLRALVQANALPVVAIGNEGPGCWSYPGAFPECVAVGAATLEGQVADFSGSGEAEGTPRPDVVGYGVGICAAFERDYEGRPLYETISGTSQAAPYVAGIAALLRSRDPEASVADVRARLVEEALPLAAERARAGAGLARIP